MKRLFLVFFMACSLVQLLTGCSSVSVQTKQYLNIYDVWDQG